MEKYGSSSAMPKGDKGSSGKIMKNHGNTTSIATTNAQLYDMGRVKNRPFCQEGYPSQAFDYKY